MTALQGSYALGKAYTESILDYFIASLSDYSPLPAAMSPVVICPGCTMMLDPASTHRVTYDSAGNYSHCDTITEPKGTP